MSPALAGRLSTTAPPGKPEVSDILMALEAVGVNEISQVMFMEREEKSGRVSMERIDIKQVQRV